MQAHEKPHRDIAAYVSSLGTPDWWTQMVTVGYERIRGLRQRMQRRDGGYEASKSRTFNVPVARLFSAFADESIRGQWLPVDITIRSAAPGKRMRITWPDGTSVQLAFTAKSPTKSTVAVQHEKLPNRSAVDAIEEGLERTPRSPAGTVARLTLRRRRLIRACASPASERPPTECATRPSRSRPPYIAKVPPGVPHTFVNAGRSTSSRCYRKVMNSYERYNEIYGKSGPAGGLRAEP